MADTMQAAVMYGIEDVRVEQVPKPQITSPDQALVKVGAVGICGSDLHYYQHGYIGDFVVTEPLILGHEAAGQVVEVGEQVTQLQSGDRVAIEPGRTCQRCEYCKSGRYNLCRDVIFLATPPVDGAFCEYLAWPADFLFKLPDNMSLADGAMMEPLSVGMHAARLAGVKAGDTVAVLGAGPIGLTALQAARVHGATTVIVSDVIPRRLQTAEKLGATNVLNAAEVDVVEAIMDLTGGRGVDVAFECVGLAPTVAQALKVARAGGKVQLVGMGPATIDDFPIWDILAKELSVSGLFRYANCYPPSIAVTASGQVDVKSLVTHRFPLEETPPAMQWVIDHKDEVIKAVITI